jgi:hypothetical protein
MADPTNPNPNNWPDPDSERAQPGDVLGIERGGETTNLGDTEEDEDTRRRQAEDDVAEEKDQKADQASASR